MADLIDSIARQVRSTRADGHHDAAIHKLITADTADHVGRRYKTRCHRYLYRDEGAILTTREVSCSECQGAKVRPRKSAARRELEGAGVLVGASP